MSTNPIGNQAIQPFTPEPALCPFEQYLPPDIYALIISRLSFLECGAFSLTCRPIHTQIWTHLIGRLSSIYFRSVTPIDPEKSPLQHLQHLKEQFRRELNVTNGVFSSKTVRMKFSAGTFVQDLSGLSLGHMTSDGKFRILDLKTMFLCPKVSQNPEVSNLSANFQKYDLGSADSFVDTKGGRLVFACQDGTIKIGDFNANIYATLQGHNKQRVSDFLLDENRLISRSDYQTSNQIKIWNLDEKALDKNNKCLATIDKTCRICSYVTDGQMLILGLENGEIERWDLNKIANSPVVFSEKHNRSIHILRIYKEQEMLISVSSDHIVKFWDLKTGTCIKTSNLGDRSDVIKSVSTNQKSILPAVNGGMRKIFDLDTQTCTSVIINTRPVQLQHRYKRELGDIFLDEQKLFITVISSGRNAESLIFNIRDFKASDRDIFSQIAGLLSENVEEAMDRFSKMPLNARNAIYGELYLIIKSLDNNYSGSGEDAFHNLNGMFSTSKQRAQAIRNYLEATKEP